MPRNPSTAVKGSLTAQETGEAYIKLVTVKANDGSVIARFTDDSVQTDFDDGGGVETYFAYPFDMSLPDNREGQETKAQLTMTNVDRLLVDNLRNTVGNLFVDLRVILSSNHNIMAYYPDMELRSVSYNTMAVSGDLTYESFLQEPYPKDLMTARHFPGLFIQ